MFESFFPKPKAFFLSGTIIGIISMIIWYYFGENFGTAIGLPWPSDDEQPVIGLRFFISNNFLTFYVYFALIAGAFAAYWLLTSRSKWRYWSVLGTIFILFFVWFTVQVSVLLNYWSRWFYDMFQNAISGEGGVTAGDLFLGAGKFLEICLPYIAVVVFNRFFTSHYVFRWRNAMTDFYTSKWKQVRKIEGASQRIQEDTMRFASITENLGVTIVDAVMTLFAFLPILYGLSEYITEIPILGDIPAPLVIAALFWAILGTVLMLVFGIKLPGLEFKNQRVEAAYRKELVYGEDDPDRAQEDELNSLFADVRKNYFRLYFHYSYFNVVRYFYLQIDNVYSLLILIPSVIAGTITLGIWQQISRAFSQVSSSFQFLIQSWPTIIELLSVRKRLVAFEAAIEGQELPEIDQEFLDEQKAGN